MSILSQRLKEAMDNRGIRAIELSRASGVPKSAISMYLAGKNKPKDENLSSLAKVLMVNEAWLRGTEGAPMEPPVFTQADLDPQRQRAYKIIDMMSDEKVDAFIALHENN